MSTTPEEYIAGLDEPRRSDVESLDELIHTTLPELEREFADGMIGYGPFHYRYASGREGDTFLLSLTSRKAHISLYVLCSVDGAYLAERYADRLGKKVSVGKSCVRIKRASDVDLDVLRQLVVETGRLGPGDAASRS